MINNHTSARAPLRANELASLLAQRLSMPPPPTPILVVKATRSYTFVRALQPGEDDLGPLLWGKFKTEQGHEFIVSRHLGSALKDEYEVSTVNPTPELVPEILKALRSNPAKVTWKLFL